MMNEEFIDTVQEDFGTEIMIPVSTKKATKEQKFYQKLVTLQSLLAPNVVVHGAPVHFVISSDIHRQRLESYIMQLVEKHYGFKPVDEELYSSMNESERSNYLKHLNK